MKGGSKFHTNNFVIPTSYVLKLISNNENMFYSERRKASMYEVSGHCLEDRDVYI